MTEPDDLDTPTDSSPEQYDDSAEGADENGVPITSVDGSEKEPA
jgi:hypothetical protein